MNSLAHINAEDLNDFLEDFDTNEDLIFTLRCLTEPGDENLNSPRRLQNQEYRELPVNRFEEGNQAPEPSEHSKIVPFLKEFLDGFPSISGSQFGDLSFLDAESNQSMLECVKESKPSDDSWSAGLASFSTGRTSRGTRFSFSDTSSALTLTAEEEQEEPKNKDQENDTNLTDYLNFLQNLVKGQFTVEFDRISKAVQELKNFSANNNLPLDDFVLQLEKGAFNHHMTWKLPKEIVKEIRNWEGGFGQWMEAEYFHIEEEKNYSIRKFLDCILHPEICRRIFMLELGQTILMHAMSQSRGKSPLSPYDGLFKFWVVTSFLKPENKIEWLKLGNKALNLRRVLEGMSQDLQQQLSKKPRELVQILISGHLIRWRGPDQIISHLKPKSKDAVKEARANINKKNFCKRTVDKLEEFIKKTRLNYKEREWFSQIKGAEIFIYYLKEKEGTCLTPYTEELFTILSLLDLSYNDYLQKKEYKGVTQRMLYLAISLYRKMEANDQADHLTQSDGYKKRKA